MYKRKMKLIPQSKKLIKEMREAGYPTCLKKGDWPGNYPRHCNSCIKSYKNLINNYWDRIKKNIKYYL